MSEQSTQHTNVKKAETKPSAKTHSRSKLNVPFAIAIIAILISIVTVIVTLQNQQQYANKYQQLHNKLEQTQTALANQQQAINQTQQSLIKQIRQAGYQSEDWSLAESLYLLKLAHYNLVFFKNVKLAQQLVNAADQNLAQLDDPTLLNARRQLAKAQTQIKAAQQLDLPGLLLQLNAIQQEIVHLPLVHKRLPQQQITKQPATPQRWWQKMWNNLKQVVVIHRLQQPPPAILPPQQQAYLLDNIQYQITQAQWAALYQKQQLYESSLKQANLWIKRYFLADNQTTQSVINTLEQLSNMNISPKIPDIAETVKAVQQALNKRQQESKQQKKESSDTNTNIKPKTKNNTAEPKVIES